MIGKLKHLLLIILFSGLLSPHCFAEEAFFTASCDSSFPESMLALQELINRQGYTISRVQHVDKGLRARGYKTGLYRVVFFGKKKEIQTIRNKYPTLIPYIPLSITIFEGDNHTGISSIAHKSLYQLYNSNEIKRFLELWHTDILNMFTEFKKCNI